MAGGALGFDTLAAQTVLSLKEYYPQIKLVLALPCQEQTRGWPAKDIEKYGHILNSADEIIYTAEKYFPGCMHARNRYMAERSDVCICYLTEDKGGAAYTVKYAKQKGLRIINIAQN